MVMDDYSTSVKYGSNRVKNHTIKANGGIEVWRQEFLTLALDEGERLVSSSGQLTPEIGVPVTN
jgi:hypothetical protein